MPNCLNWKFLWLVTWWTTVKTSIPWCSVRTAVPNVKSKVYLSKAACNHKRALCYISAWDSLKQLYELDSGERMCGSTNSSWMACDSVILPTHHFSNQHVCGKATGFVSAIFPTCQVGYGLVYGKSTGFSYYHPCAWASFFPVYDCVHNNNILGSITQRAKLCTAVIAGVHWH